MRPRFQADADFNEDIVSGVLRRVPEIDFQTANDAGFASLSDPDILSVAANDGRILITHDRRTMPIHFGTFIQTKISPGVFIIQQETEIVRIIGLDSNLGSLGSRRIRQLNSHRASVNHNFAVTAS